MKILCAILFAVLWLTNHLSTASAQMGGRQDAMNILNSMSPELYGKVQRLAQMLDQSIKAGKLTEGEVQQGMLSGHLGEKLKSIDPEAGRLLDDISEAMKNGQGPGEAALMPLLGGLGIAP
ncbi:hypothetical protein [Nitrospira moscoviensis]|uniref:Uncharacterized protein n=1 Tax=Nitrospira moscoviensis TaxID=42253 RepID=A0A0K2GGI1_NITMO|nr:hypothetical protein [Nitrospira moscoviensis]ALA59939.1 exported protein of unknown function [Nitrospira moscoviensis]